MEQVINNIAKRLNNGKTIDAEKLQSIIRAANKGKHGNHIAKKHLMPYYLAHASSFNFDKNTHDAILNILRVKPKRSASGVSTITVITKPWPCGGNCIYCPNDIRMPKSYLSNEPACQRAERNFFDPYLQVTARLKALMEMGHNTDKIEMIVLGGTWNDYEKNYQKWFVKEIFRALNEETYDKNLEQAYFDAGYTNDLSTLENNAKNIQDKINAGKLNYNDAFDMYYKNSEDTARKLNAALENQSSNQYANTTNENQSSASNLNISSMKQTASWQDVEQQQKINETAKHRCVGLVFETRPAQVTEDNLKYMRRLGCTKVQMGVQSLDGTKIKLSERDNSNVKHAFKLMRDFGFKIHAHFMTNLPGATVSSDIKDYIKLVTDPHFMPDEIKLYPCMLVESARLNKLANKSLWHAYSEDELIDLLAYDIENTPCFTRVSRVMRDISSTDITQGVKKTNLRQMVDNKLKGKDIQEIRHREIVMSNTDETILDDYIYKTNNSTEHFLQYITKDNKILGFLRLSLNDRRAMIREVHVYGKVAKIGSDAQNAQHTGLGTKLIETAVEIATNDQRKHKKLYVISAIGTRQYYEKRGFKLDGLYQARTI